MDYDQPSTRKYTTTASISGNNVLCLTTKQAFIVDGPSLTIKRQTTDGTHTIDTTVTNAFGAAGDATHATEYTYEISCPSSSAQLNLYSLPVSGSSRASAGEGNGPYESIESYLFTTSNSEYPITAKSTQHDSGSGTLTSTYTNANFFTIIAQNANVAIGDEGNIVVSDVSGESSIPANGNNNNVQYNSYIITDYPKEYTTETPSLSFEVNVGTRVSNLPEVNFEITPNTIYDQSTQSTAPTNYNSESATCSEEVNIDEVGKHQFSLESGKLYCVTTMQGFVIDKGTAINIQRGNEIARTDCFGATSDGVNTVTFTITTDETNPQTVDVYYIHVYSPEFPTFNSYVILENLENAELTSFDGSDDYLSGSILTILRQDGTVTITPNSASVGYDARSNEEISTETINYPASVVALSKYRTKAGFKPALISLTATGTLLEKAQHNFAVTNNSILSYPTESVTYESYKISLDDCNEFQDYSLAANQNSFKSKININGQGTSTCIMSDSAFVIPARGLTIKMSDGRSRDVQETAEAFGAGSNENITFYKITTDTQLDDQDIYLIPELPHTESYLVLSGSWEGNMTSQHLITVNDAGRTEECVNRNLIAVINSNQEIDIHIAPDDGVSIRDEYSDLILDLSNYQFNEGAAYTPVLNEEAYSSMTNSGYVYTESFINVSGGSAPETLPNINFVLSKSTIFSFSQESNTPTYYRPNTEPDDDPESDFPLDVVIGVVIAVVVIIVVIIISIVVFMKKRRRIQAELSDGEINREVQDKKVNTDENLDNSGSNTKSSEHTDSSNDSHESSSKEGHSSEKEDDDKQEDHSDQHHSEHPEDNSSHEQNDQHDENEKDNENSKSGEVAGHETV